jgi:uncharacterized protein (DUF1778 family)
MPIISIRVTSEEKQQLKEMAKMRGCSLSSMLIEIAVMRARRVLAARDGQPANTNETDTPAVHLTPSI